MYDSHWKSNTPLFVQSSTKAVHPAQVLLTKCAPSLLSLSQDIDTAQSIMHEVIYVVICMIYSASLIRTDQNCPS